MKIKEALNFIGSRLEKEGIENAILESELYLRHNFDFSRADLYMKIDQDVEFDRNKAEEFVKARKAGYPFAYMLGKVSFMGFDIFVDKRVLIPRQETELLVEAVLKSLSVERCELCEKIIIVEIGTGSGNIAVSLAKMIQNVKIYATDISKNALGVARDNAASNNVSEETVSFYEGDIFSPLDSFNLKNKVDIIVSNPPYIPSADISGLQPEVQSEPRIALDGGKDGMDFYGRIIREAPAYLKKGGCLFMEMGIGQAEKIKELFRSSPGFGEPGIIKDYSNIERIIYARMENGKICN